MATAATPRFDYNVNQAEMSLGINAEGRRVLTPAWQTGGLLNGSDGKSKLMTLGDFLPLFAELWESTGNGLSPPSYFEHRNLFELWRLWSQNKQTLVSDCFELEACPFSVKVAETA